MTGITALIGHPAAARLSLALVHFVWQGAGLAFIAVVLLSLLRNASAGARYAGLLVVFAAMAACPVVTFALTGDSPASIATSTPARIPRAEASPSPSVPAVAESQQPPVSAGLELDRRTSSMAPVPERWVVRARKWVGARLPWITLLWLGGVVALSLRLVSRWWAVGRIRGALESASADWQHSVRRLSLSLRMRRPVRLLTSAASRVPMVVGWLRPVIVIPASALTGLTSDQLAAILTHELAHIRRFDHFVNLAQTVVEILLFYHPAVWWVSSAIRAERENCCDDVAVRVSGDVVGYMRALAWIEQKRSSVPEAAIASSGTSLLSRIRRLAGAVTPPAAGYSWLAAAMALAVVMVFPITAAVSGLAAGHGPGQHGLGAREQWQPQLADTDARLQQPVHIEIIGRAGVPALAMLSEQSGVSLAVAPEDLATVGERKLTVIAQGCTLKALMVQIPKALQECHWDIDPSGPQPVYLLHRNAGTDLTMAELVEEGRTRREDETRPAREARVESTRKALAMSEQELAELAKTDPLLAASVKDPERRKEMELFLSLPSEPMQEFLANGSITLSYTSAPERFQQGCRELLQGQLEWARQHDGDKFLIDGFAYGLSNPDDVTFTYQSYDGPWSGIGTWLGVNVYMRDGGYLRFISAKWPATPPRAPRNDEGDIKRYRDLLVKTGVADDNTAETLVAELAKEQDQGAREARERKRALARREPRSPALHRTITLPFAAEERVDRTEVQRYLAKETGLSIISDCFTTWGPREIPDEATTTMPVWRLLYVLGENWFWTYDWNEAGDCLVFHDRFWYRLAQEEFPESMVTALRDKVRQQGCLTPDDIAAAAVELERRRPAHPSLRDGLMMVPEDLRNAGVYDPAITSEALLIYASLTPEQRAKARSAEGLPYQDMTAKQQELVRRSNTSGADKRPLPDEQIAKAVYCINDWTETVRSEPKLVYELQVEFPSRQVRTMLWLRPPRSAPEPAPAEQE